nr:DUF3304 domain-containing protein [Pseudomonas sp. Au-Pse12]
MKQMRRTWAWKTAVSLTGWLSAVLLVTACQSQSTMLSAPVTGYNHTSAAINRFSVNGAGGGNIGPHQGGGSQVCCGVVPRHWVPGLKAIVEWEKDPNPYSSSTWTERPYSDAWTKRMKAQKQEYSRHKVTVEIPRYSVAGTLKVHFLPCNQVRVSADNIKVKDPRYPYSYPMEMEEPEICQGQL